jgi:hypothetical protein
MIVQSCGLAKLEGAERAPLPAEKTVKSAIELREPVSSIVGQARRVEAADSGW